MSRKNGIGGHQLPRMLKDEWLTPKSIVDALGPFDLDPCAPIKRPWDTARKHLTVIDNGLLTPWDPRDLVWMNPPYGQHISTWMERMAIHNNGIALIFARTETDMFFKYVWDKASCLLFLRGRINFYHVNGQRSILNSGAPSVFVGYGKTAYDRLENCKLKGKFVVLNPNNSHPC